MKCQTSHKTRSIKLTVITVKQSNYKKDIATLASVTAQFKSWDHLPYEHLHVFVKIEFTALFSVYVSTTPIKGFSSPALTFRLKFLVSFFISLFLYFIYLNRISAWNPKYCAKACNGHRWNMWLWMDSYFKGGVLSSQTKKGNA